MRSDIGKYNTRLGLMLASQDLILARVLFWTVPNSSNSMPRVILSSFPSSRVALRSGRLVLCALTVAMGVLSGCSVQKRTTQRGWHVESSFGNKKPAPQAELMQSETPRVRWIHRPSSALQLPLITHQLPSTPLSRLLPEQEKMNLCKDTVEHQDASNSAPMDVADESPLDAQASTPVPMSRAEASDSEETNSFQFLGLMGVMLGIAMLPSPVGAMSIALGLIFLLIGRNVKLSKAPKVKHRRKRKAGNVLLMLVAAVLGGIAMIVLFLSALFGDMSNLFEGWSWPTISW